MNNIDKFWELVAVTQESWNNTFGVNEIEPHLLDILQFVKNHPNEKTKFVNCFITLVRGHCGPLEIVEFCMRELQWPEVREAALQRQLDSKDFRVLDAMENIIAVYSDKWDDADLYQYYTDS